MVLFICCLVCLLHFATYQESCNTCVSFGLLRFAALQEEQKQNPVLQKPAFQSRPHFRTKVQGNFVGAPATEVSQQIAVRRAHKKL